MKDVLAQRGMSHAHSLCGRAIRVPTPARRAALVTARVSSGAVAAPVQKPWAEPAPEATLPETESSLGPTPQDAAAEIARRSFILQDTCSFLTSDLKVLVEKGEVTSSRYAASFQYEDPVLSLTGVDAYVLMVRAIRTLFKSTFDLHSVEATSRDEVTARWTLIMELPLPWKPTITLTGSSLYVVDPSTGAILSQTDSWDALSRNQYLSLEGLQHLIGQVTTVQITPNIETPKYVVLKRLKEYELRKYESYMVAEAPMNEGAGPASGSGFGDLARYLFGGNEQLLSMEMTTPVFTTVEPTNSSVSMQFVMERRYSDVSALPQPSDRRIVRKKEEGTYVASISFAGWPLDYEVVQNERLLRDLLIRDGLKPMPGYQLARYNDPSTPPMLRRNEVLIKLNGFGWP